VFPGVVLNAIGKGVELIQKDVSMPDSEGRTRTLEILERIILGGRQTHRFVGDKAGDAVVAGAINQASRNDQPMAADGLRSKRGADGLGAAAAICPGPQTGSRPNPASTNVSHGLLGEIRMRQQSR
jgi:hypothetical protein